MPACVTIFDKNCKPLMELGEGPYNTLRWNPKGKGMILFFITCFSVVFLSLFLLNRGFVYMFSFLYNFALCSTVLCVAGFGNLPGDMVYNDPCILHVFQFSILLPKQSSLNGYISGVLGCCQQEAARK